MSRANASNQCAPPSARRHGGNGVRGSRGGASAPRCARGRIGARPASPHSPVRVRNRRSLILGLACRVSCESTAVEKGGWRGAAEPGKNNFVCGFRTLPFFHQWRCQNKPNVVWFVGAAAAPCAISMSRECCVLASPLFLSPLSKKMNTPPNTCPLASFFIQNSLGRPPAFLRGLRAHFFYVSYTFFLPAREVGRGGPTQAAGVCPPTALLMSPLLLCVTAPAKFALFWSTKKVCSLLARAPPFLAWVPGREESLCDEEQKHVLLFSQNTSLFCLCSLPRHRRCVSHAPSHPLRLGAWHGRAPGCGPAATQSANRRRLRSRAPSRRPACACLPTTRRPVRVRHSWRGRAAGIGSLFCNFAPTQKQRHFATPPFTTMRLAYVLLLLTTLFLVAFTPTARAGCIKPDACAGKAGEAGASGGGGGGSVFGPGWLGGFLGGFGEAGDPSEAGVGRRR